MRGNATTERWAGAAERATGKALDSVERVAGGTRKGVYRLRAGDGTSVIAYRWERAEDYWPEAAGDGDRAHPFSAGVGQDLYLAAHAKLVSLGLRQPAIHLMYFDVEWEHVFLRIRLHDDYHWVAVDGLDEDRLALYMLVQRLSLTAGPLRLLDGDFPDREFMAGIAEWNLKQALELVRRS